MIYQIENYEKLKRSFYFFNSKHNLLKKLKKTLNRLKNTILTKMLKINPLIAYSISSIGILALLYKFLKGLKLRKMANTYFQDKTVLVTGASQGLGKGTISRSLFFFNFIWFLLMIISYLAIAQELYPLGAQLIICARNKDELLKLKSELMRV